MQSMATGLHGQRGELSPVAPQAWAEGRAGHWRGRGPAGGRSLTRNLCVSLALLAFQGQKSMNLLRLPSALSILQEWDGFRGSMVRGRGGWLLFCLVMQHILAGQDLGSGDSATSRLVSFSPHRPFVCFPKQGQAVCRGCLCASGGSGDGDDGW